jgi:ketosteroid isomerase-like protein
MDIQNEKRMVAEFLAGFEVRDASKIAPLLADNFEYRVMISMPGAQTAFDRDQTLNVFLPMLKETVPGGFNFKIHTVVAEGPSVAVQAESNTVTAQGRKYANRYHFYFRFEGDKIAQCLEYCDTNHLREVFFTPI